MTPNLVKAVLQYTAESRSKYDYLTQGAGFLNARGAVQLSQALAARTTPAGGDPTPWSRHIIWGNRRIGGTINPDATVWRADVMWGAATAKDTTNIVMAAPGRDDEDVVWGTVCDEAVCGIAVWDEPLVPGAAWGSILSPAADDVVWRPGVDR
jgi:hypothetical protein